jgi:hypothetical protein
LYSVRRLASIFRAQSLNHHKKGRRVARSLLWLVIYFLIWRFRLLSGLSSEALTTSDPTIYLRMRTVHQNGSHYEIKHLCHRQVHLLPLALEKGPLSVARHAMDLHEIKKFLNDVGFACK